MRLFIRHLGKVRSLMSCRQHRSGNFLFLQIQIGAKLAAAGAVNRRHHFFLGVNFIFSTLNEGN